MVGRLLGFLYGVVAYVVFLGSFLYAIGFVGNLMVPKGIDGGTAGPFASALLVNALLLGLFAVQHSVMARPWFKKAWTRVVPPSIERSTYVLLASLLLLLLYWQWRPMPDMIWSVESPAGAMTLIGLFWLGWLLVLLSTLMIDHFDLFGLRQVSSLLTRRSYIPPKFQTTGLYKYVRHPIMLGFIIAFWATPRMSVGHLLFAVATTGYILLAIQFEEHDLRHGLGPKYDEYRRHVSMIVPSGRAWEVEPAREEAPQPHP